MNLLQVLLNPEREEREALERTLVCDAANVLQIGEFDFLQLAWRDWYGGEPPEALSARLFGRYMLLGEVPPWARHFARAVLSRVEPSATALPSAGIGDAAVVPSAVRQFCLAAGIVALTLVAALLAAGTAGTHPASRMPPWFDRAELPLGEEMPDDGWAGAGGSKGI